MTGKTHIAGGILTSAIVFGDVATTLFIIVGSILPDIDHGGSIFGKNIPLVHKLFKHRVFTHSIVFLVICSLLINQWLGLGMMVHLLFDMMTKQGIELLWPIKCKMNLYPIAEFISTGGIFEKCLYYLCYMGTAVVLVGYKFAYLYL